MTKNVAITEEKPNFVKKRLCFTEQHNAGNDARVTLEAALAETYDCTYLGEDCKLLVDFTRPKGKNIML